MAFNFNPRNWIFPFYLLIISGLFGYLLQLRAERQRQLRRNMEVYSTMKQISEALNRDVERQFRTVEKFSKTYPCAYNSMLRRQGEQVKKQLAFLKNLLNTVHSKHILSIENQSVAQTLPYITDSLFTFQKGFVDSLLTFSGRDEKFRNSLDSAYSSKGFEVERDLLKQGHPDQKAAILESINLKNTAATSRLMAWLKKRTFDGDPFEFKAWQLIPVVSLEKDCFRAGETIRGDVHAAVYSEMTDNVKMFVDDKEIPIEKGFGKITRTYSTSGLKRLNVNILVKNPVTVQTQKYSLEFQLQIYQ